MAVKIGSARSDENRAAYGGKAGDQTGREVSTQDWYLHSKGWRVFRAHSADIRMKLADAMLAACGNPMIGYDQKQRHTLYTLVQNLGYDPAKAYTPCECDCSSLVRVCLAYAGIRSIPSDFRTGNMGKYLLATGEFTEMMDDKYTTKASYLMRGDILVTKTSGHTVIVLTDGKNVVHPSDPHMAVGDRTIRKGTRGEDVRYLQNGLMDMGYDVGSWGADGICGNDTVSAINEFKADHGLNPDGIFGVKAARIFNTMMRE